MAGHNKWSKVKHIKAKEDAKKGKAYTKCTKEITVAAKLGGGDPDANPRLRAAIQAAKDVSMPKDNIDRAIKKGTGELQGDSIEECTYEGYGPAGVAVIVEATTDNKNRTVADLRRIFTKKDGNLGEGGSVLWMFERCGQLFFDGEQHSEDKVMEVALEAGADDVITSADGYEVRCEINQFDKVIHALETAGIKTASAEISYLATTTVPVTDAGVARSILKLHDALDALDDVQAVFSNEEMDEALRDAAEE